MSPFGSTDREHVLDLFREVCVAVWGKSSIDQLTLLLDARTPSMDGQYQILAAVAYAGKPLAMGRHLIRAADSRTYKLLVSDALLAMDDATIKKVLVHEACHLGYKNHGREFRELVVANGGTLSGGGVEEGYQFEVQRKEGARFKTIKTFDPDAPHAEAEAMAWMRQESSRAPGRYRLVM